MEYQDYTYEAGLETKRLKTQFLKPNDYRHFIAFMADKECRAYLPFYDIESPKAMSEFLVNKQIDRYQQQRYGLQLLIHKTSNEVIGLCGLLLQQVDEGTELEVGYHLLKPYWGKGFASEAAQFFKNYGFKNSKVSSIVSMIVAGNTKSQQVATRNGMKPDPEREWLGQRINIYRIYREDWHTTL